MHPNKAPGLNDFPTFFYQKCWNFLEIEVWEIVEEFKIKKKIIKYINNIALVLIPKKNECTNMRDYRPISLRNTI